MKIKNILYLILFVFVVMACDNDDNNTPVPIDPEPEDMSGFARGADVSWLTEMESNDILFYDSAKVETECMALLKSLGMNSIRLRVWVNPESGWCNKNDLLMKAKRAADLNMRVMVDFHYSDEWADPGDQYKPVAWKDYTLTELCIAVAEHTTDVLSSLKEWGVTPEWVQVGNETTNGMLWNDEDAYADNSGHLLANNGANYTKLNNAAYDASKAIFPDAKVVLHIDRGYNKDITSNVLTRIIGNDNDCEDARFDVLGLSLYPSASNYKSLVASCKTNMQWVVDNYDKDVMLCEVGMENDQAEAANFFLTEIIAQTKAVTDAQGNERGLGVFYWEPQSYNAWKGYTMGAFDTDGKPTMALKAFAKTVQ